MFTTMLVQAILGIHSIEVNKPVDEVPGAYVEFDFSTLAQGGEGECAFTLIVLTTDKDLKYSIERKGPKELNRETECAAYATSMQINKFKAEVVDKTKLRVYGRIWNDKLIPATKGMVESKDLKPEELPKVKNPTGGG